MSARSTILTLGLCLGLCGCTNLPKRGSTVATTDSGVLSESLNREQRERLQLIGRTSAPTRYIERTDANRIRVVAIDFGGVTLGQCADDDGNLLAYSCLRTGSSRSISMEQSDHRFDFGAQGRRPQPDLLPAPPDDSSSELSSMTSGMFRQYSTQVGTTVEASVAAGTVGANTKVYFSRNFLVLEWRRFYLDKAELEQSDSHAPFVSAIEKGIAVRIIFDVRLRTADAKLTANFGIADLSTALARNEATVEVSYEILGITLDPVPSKALIITSLTEYLAAIDEFYRAVNLISRAAQEYESNGKRQSFTFNINDGTSLAVKDMTVAFQPAALAYYVTGRGVGLNHTLLKNVEECQAYTAKDTFLKDSIQSTLAARGGSPRGASRRNFRRGLGAETQLYRAYYKFRRHRPRRKGQARRREDFHHGLLARIARYERIKKPDAHQNRSLEHTRRDLDALERERQELAALSAQLNCERACKADVKRITDSQARWVEMLRMEEQYVQTELDQAKAAVSDAASAVAAAEAKANEDELREANELAREARKNLSELERWTKRISDDADREAKQVAAKTADAEALCKPVKLTEPSAANPASIDEGAPTKKQRRNN